MGVSFAQVVVRDRRTVRLRVPRRAARRERFFVVLTEIEGPVRARQIYRHVRVI